MACCKKQVSKLEECSVIECSLYCIACGMRHADQSWASHHVNGRPHEAHVLLGKFSFLTVLPFSFFMGTANATVRAVARAHLPWTPPTPMLVSLRRDKYIRKAVTVCENNDRTSSPG